MEEQGSEYKSHMQQEGYHDEDTRTTKEISDHSDLVYFTLFLTIILGIMIILVIRLARGGNTLARAPVVISTNANDVSVSSTKTATLSGTSSFKSNA